MSMGDDSGRLVFVDFLSVSWYDLFMVFFHYVSWYLIVVRSGQLVESKKNKTIVMLCLFVLLMVLFAGVISGIANGLMYKTGYSNGGFPVVSQVLFEKKHISVAKSSLVINVSIVLVGALFFGTTNALYAIIFLYINNIVLNLDFFKFFYKI
mgnify:CR=1 FL=1